MPPSDFIKDVGEVDFEYEVMLFSKSLPVLVYFWADWCKPCRVIDPFLERLAYEAGGSFRLARVDSDANPNLAIRYEVRTLPTIKAIVDEEVTGSLIGPQPENRIVNFIQHLAPPSQFVLDVEKANGYLSQKLWAKAETEFRKVLDEEPNNASALLGLVRSIVPQGKSREAINLLDVFPASREYQSAEGIRPLVEEMLLLDKEMQEEGEDELLPAYRNSINLVRKGNLLPAMDGLIDILRASKTYRHGKARLSILGVLEILGKDDALTRDYRAELASILF